VEKLAAEAGCALLALSPSAVLSKWAGESERTLRAAFDVGRALQPCIIFIDEVDALGAARSGATEDGGAGRRLLSELLVQMSAAAGEEALLVFAATNRLQDVDAALLRRFDRRIELPLPAAAARRGYLEVALARPEMGHRLSPGDVAALAAATEGYSTSDLAALCRDAAMAPVRELFRAPAKRRRSGGSGGGGGGGCVALERRSGGAGGGGGRASGKAERRSGGAGAAAAAGPAPPHRLRQPVAEADLRPLTRADFEAAAARVRPPAADQLRAAHAAA